MAKSDSGNPKSHRILIARFSALGDVAMTIPVVYSVCRTYPDKEFCMLTSRFAAALFINAPANLHIKGVETGNYKGLLGIKRLADEVWTEFSPDTFADLHGVLRTYLLAFFLRFKGVKICHIDKGRSGKRALTRARDKRMLPQVSSRARYREVFFRLGLGCEYKFASLFDGKGASSDFSEISAPKHAGETWIAVAPFAKHKGKIYPVGQMKKVVEAIAGRPDTRIFLFGGGGNEQQILEKWADELTCATSLAGKRYGFLKELSLLSHCDVMVSMDSANMHLASLVGLPVVSIWGATHPYCGFMGWKQDEDNVVQLNMACRPCSVFGNKPCRTNDYYCLNGIPPEMITDRINKVLERNKK